MSGNQVYFRIREQETLDAFKKACHDSGKSAAELAQDMIKHCLKDAGYLK